MLIYIYLLFIHWLADFVLQNDWMAQNKNKNLFALSTHVLIYYFILLIGTFNSLWAFFNCGLHFLIDFVTSKINAKLWQNKKIHWFFVSVGFDQFLHTAILLLTWR